MTAPNAVPFTAPTDDQLREWEREWEEINTKLADTTYSFAVNAHLCERRDRLASHITPALLALVRKGMWTCPDCAFSFAVEHVDEVTGTHSCPNCAEARLTIEVRALRADGVDKDTLNAQATFTEWFLANYPEHCRLANPNWHAPRIFRAARSALTPTARTGGAQ